jgi:phage protein D
MWYSKPINTKQITQRLATLNLNRQVGQDSRQIELVIPDTLTTIAEIPAESSTQAQIQIPPK